MRIDRAQPIRESDLEAWQAEIGQLFEQELGIHFEAEETVLFPAARQFSEFISLVDELIREHASLRESLSAAQARQMSIEALLKFAQALSAHIRKEERQLFESMQRLMTAEQLALLGARLQTALKDASTSCALPNQATKLRARQ